MIITVDRIMSAGPCDDWPRERVEAVIGDGKTPREIAELAIDLEDRHWVLWECLPRSITTPVLEVTITRALNSPDVIAFAKANAAYGAWRLAWLRGKNRSHDAAESAVRDVAWNAAESAAEAAARAAAWAAASAAARVPARDAELQLQINELVAATEA